LPCSRLLFSFHCLATGLPFQAGPHASPLGARAGPTLALGYPGPAMHFCPRKKSACNEMDILPDYKDTQQYLYFSTPAGY